MSSYPTREAAEAALIADGWTPSARTSGVYVTADTVDDWYGGYTTNFLCRVRHNKVDPKWDKPDFYTIDYL